MSLDGFSMSPLIAELNQHLSGSRVDKITQLNKQSILLSLRQPGQTYNLHISINAQNPVIHIIHKPMENLPEPPVFCMVLRKQIEGGRIAQIRQHSLDRLVIIDIDVIGAGGLIVTKSLIVELMGKYSNMILLQEGKIIDALRKVGHSNSRVRLVLPGCEYTLPPNQDKLDIFSTPADECIEALKSLPELALSKAIINTCLGLGPVSAKEIAFGAGLDPTILVSNLDQTDFTALASSLKEIVLSCKKESIKPTLVLDENKKLIALAAFPLHIYPDKITQTFTSMSEMLEFSGKLSGHTTLPDKERFKKLIHTELVRAQNKAQVLQEELVQAHNAEEYKIRGDVLMTYQYQLTDHELAEVELPDIYSETGASIKIKLDKRLTTIQNMQAYYHKYDKFKRAQALLLVQIKNCADNLAYLDSIENSLESSTKLAELNEIKTELISTGYLNERIKKKTMEKPSKPFKFSAPDNTVILVGKNNLQNDKLTFKTAHHNDIWLHTKDIPGSHVIIRCENEPVSEETLRLAADIAAHFSKAQGSSKIPVDYTRCRYVKKPAGAKPGFVIFTNQKTLYQTPDAEKLTHILAKDLNA
jgi:predicted ribosome quality control (RQC) complex YloA/Tae2 family protein